MVLQVQQEYASLFALQNYASLVLPTEIHLTFHRISCWNSTNEARAVADMELFGADSPTKFTNGYT